MHEKNDHNYLGYLANHEASQSAACNFGQSGHLADADTWLFLMCCW